MHAQGLMNQAHGRRLPVAGRVLLLIVVGLSLVGPGQLPADGGHGAFTVARAETRRGESDWRLDAVFSIRLSEGAQEALENGVPLVLDLQVQALEKQPWLWDAVVAEQKRSRQLQFHALSRTYLVRDLNTGFQRSFRYLEEALQYAGVLEDVSVLGYEAMKDDRQYAVRLRGGLDIESLPTPVRLLAYVSSAWDMDSNWHQWRLAR
jgi:hypothetical protein